MPILVRPFFFAGVRLAQWNPFTHWLRFQFSIGIYSSIRSDQSFVFVYVHQRTELTSSFIHPNLFTERERDRDEIDDRIILSENPLNQKFEWLIADMGILLILWKCGNYLHLKWWGDTSNSIGDYNSSLLTMVMMNAMKRGRVQKTGARAHTTQ